MSHDATGSLPGTVGRIAQSLSGLVHTRLEILGIELIEEKHRVLRLAALAVVLLLFFSLSLCCLTLLVVVLCWDSFRWQALVLLSAAYGALAGIAAWRLRASLRHAPPAFAATRQEFRRDVEALKGVRQ